MDDATFLRRFKERLEQAYGGPVHLEVSTEAPDRVSVDFSGEVPRVVIGAQALRYPGLARMFLQYALLALRKGREVEEQEFLLFLRRN